MRTVHVDLGPRSYPIVVEAGLLKRAGRMLAGLGFEAAPIVVTNRRVRRLHGTPLLTSLQEVFGRVPVLTIGDGERYKNPATLAMIYEGLLRAHASRRSWILAFGGGVVGDVAGYAAATYMRGIPYVHVPTTLLAQVDSSIGGKVGINTPRGKNLIGAIHQPRAVLADTDVLKTLPARELAAGLYEVVKCGAIRSVPLLKFLERSLPDILAGSAPALTRTVVDAARIKAAVVARDELESAGRVILNFGHTVGHALETATGYRRFKHGEAVAWGMIAAARLSAYQSGLSAGDQNRLVRLIHRVEALPPLRGISRNRIWTAIQRDKKSDGGGLRMVLLSKLGRPEIVGDFDPIVLRRFLATFLEWRSDGG